MTHVLGRLAKHGLLVLASLIALFPVYVMLTAALKTQRGFLDNPVTPPLHPSLGGFRAALSDQFPRWFANSVILTGASVAATLMLASLAARGCSPWRVPGPDPRLAGLVSLMVYPPVRL